MIDTKSECYIFSEGNGKLTIDKSECFSSENEPVTAGDFDNLISDQEIDYFTSAALGERTFPARRFYEFQKCEIQGDLSTRAVFRSEIEEKLNGLGWISFPVWTRHHWATAMMVRQDGMTQITVYDSAAHPMTANDYKKRFKALGFHLEVVNTVQHAKQPPQSNECGLHPILLALLMKEAGGPQTWEQTAEVLDLSKWRTTLSKHFVERSQPETEELVGLLEGTKHPLVDRLRRLTSTVLGGGMPTTRIETRHAPLISGTTERDLMVDLTEEVSCELSLTEQHIENTFFSAEELQAVGGLRNPSLRKWAQELLRESETVYSEDKKLSSS
jgi:hypothetical protein